MKTLREVALEWLRKNKLGVCKPSTYHFYVDIANQLDMPANIAIDKIQDYLIELSARGYSSSRIRNILLVIRFVRSDARNLVVPRVIRQPIKYFNAEQIQQFTAGVTGKYKDLYIAILGTGMRIGEALGLTFTDINVVERCLYIQHNWYDGKLGTPKTPSSVRVIPMSEHVYDAIVNAMNTSTDTIRVFPFNYKNVARAFPDICEMIGVPHIGLHGLRHSFATKLINDGVNIKVVSELLGHASVGITMDIYYHVSIYDMRDAVNRVFMR